MGVTSLAHPSVLNINIGMSSGRCLWPRQW